MTYSTQLLLLTTIPMTVVINMFIIALVMIGGAKIVMTVAIIVPCTVVFSRGVETPTVALTAYV